MTDKTLAPEASATPDAKPLTRITVQPHPDLCPQGLSFEAKPGRKLVDAMLEAGIAIEHACEKVCACATCHVYLVEGAANVNPADDEEEDQLDKAWGLQPNSRLSCCVKVKGATMTVALPRYTKNHAREH